MSAGAATDLPRPSRRDGVEPERAAHRRHRYRRSPSTDGRWRAGCGRSWPRSRFALGADEPARAGARDVRAGGARRARGGRARAARVELRRVRRAHAAADRGEAAGLDDLPRRLSRRRDARRRSARASTGVIARVREVRRRRRAVRARPRLSRARSRAGSACRPATASTSCWSTATVNVLGYYRDAPAREDVERAAGALNRRPT